MWGGDPSCIAFVNAGASSSPVRMCRIDESASSNFDLSSAAAICGAAARYRCDLKQIKNQSKIKLGV
jgi:hypothetical protein